MTRVNCIPPYVLLDQHLIAHLKEGLRPINNILKGKTNVNGCPSDWKLGKGHEIFCRKHAIFTLRQWNLAKKEYVLRYKNYDKYCWNPSLEGILDSYKNDYKPTNKALRENLARIIVRWRSSRNNDKYKYTFNKKPIDSVCKMRQYISYVKDVCNIH